MHGRVAMTLWFLSLTIVIAVIVLMLERSRLERSSGCIPLRIAVTGTRGKSSVTRMLAAVLRADGRRVLAKTTGSEATYILPDGSPQAVNRRGRPSIMEQKRLIHMGATLEVDAIIAEIMSIHPENHAVETNQLLQPHMVVVTNFRVDHTAAMGTQPDDVARIMALDVANGAEVYVPRRECLPEFLQAVARQSHANKPSVIEVAADSGAAVLGRDMALGEFAADVDLVCAVARSLEVTSDTISRGIAAAQYDIGALTVWRYATSVDAEPCLLVNAFAANDPESTKLIYEMVLAATGRAASDCIGLMNLRRDRGDRTEQWIDALADGWLNRFKHLYLCGLHAPAVRWRLQRLARGCPVEVLRGGEPAEITHTAISQIHDTGGMVFGFGNVGELGASLTNHWRTVAEPLEI